MLGDSNTEVTSTKVTATVGSGEDSLTGPPGGRSIKRKAGESNPIRSHGILRLIRPAAEPSATALPDVFPGICRVFFRLTGNTALA